MRRAPHVVVVGFGPVASRLIEQLTPELVAGSLRLTVVGAERRPAYQRIRIGEVAVNRLAPEDLLMDDIANLEENGVSVHCNSRVTSIDTVSKFVTLRPGHADPHRDRVPGSSGDHQRIDYDKLVLATGAEPLIPDFDVEMRRNGKIDYDLKPEKPKGVLPLRDMHDALRVAAAVERRDPIMVLGGGVLGVEAALAISEVGHTVTLLHRGNTPMSRDLDADAGMILRRELLHAGVDVRSGSDVSRLVSDGGRLVAVRTSQDEKIPASMLIVCTGVRPRDDLARMGALATSWGVTVGPDARSVSNPDVFAIGDCASVEGRASVGLIASGWSQAEACVASLRTDLEVTRARESDAAGTLVDFGSRSATPGQDVILVKSKNLSVACAGDVSVDPWAPGAPTVATWSDPKRGQYLRLVTEDDQLLGFVAVGMPRSAAELAMHATRGTLPAADRTLLLAAEHATKEHNMGPEDVLCRCSGATVGMVQEAAQEGCQSVLEIGECTRAGTGCGTCHQQIGKLLETSAG